MSIKHTPGPWVCTATSHYAHDYRLEIPGGQMPFVRGEGVEYANAKLIAAAPELLDALLALMKWQVKHVHVWDNPAYDDAAKVIARATGKKP